ncbi:MAG: hypothetical protein GXZ03_01440, partial [Proteiniphilum sp.]|nr:hypothetical protein [Proteiniphilum sp.]
HGGDEVVITGNVSGSQSGVSGNNDNVWEDWDNDRGPQGGSGYWGDSGNYWGDTGNYFDDGYNTGVGGGSSGGSSSNGGGSNSGSGSNSSSGSNNGGGTSDIPPGMLDGIDINSKNYTFNTSEYSAFNKQLQSILESNSVISNLLSFFNNGVVHMTFGVDYYPKVGTKITAANLVYKSEESYHINFNSDLINEDGWNLNYSGIDNAGFDFSQARNAEERLVITLAHEAMHAKHNAIYEAAVRKHPTSSDNAANLLLNSGYSEEYVNIFFEKNSSGKWIYNYNGDRNQRMHDYMNNNNQGVIESALNEYRKDHGY